MDYCDNGNLTRFDPLDIAIAAMWEGDSDEFLDALIHCGWVDRALDVMFIHDSNCCAYYWLDFRIAWAPSSCHRAQP